MKEMFIKFNEAIKIPYSANGTLANTITVSKKYSIYDNKNFVLPQRDNWESN